MAGNEDTTFVTTTLVFELPPSINHEVLADTVEAAVRSAVEALGIHLLEHASRGCPEYAAPAAAAPPGWVDPDTLME